MKKSIAVLLLLTILCVYCNAFGNIENLEIDSKAVYMVNMDNSQVMLEKNAHKKMEPASLTKIMTTLVVLEMCDNIEDEMVYISNDDIFREIKMEGGSHIALVKGETLSVKDLLYATMLPSACDAAQLLAYHFGNGNIQNFIDKMNERAAQIGAKDTTFKNPHGLNANGHVTTAYDMYLIVSQALKNERFMEIVATSSYVIPATEKSAKRNIYYSVELVNRNSSNYYRYASGIKTGFTDQAGRCLITMAQKENARYILVLMGANLDSDPSPIKTYPDAINLFEHVFNSYNIVEIAKKDEILAQTQIYFSDNNQKQINLIPNNDITLSLPHGITEDMLVRKYTYNKDITLPLTSEQVLGQVTFLYNNRELATFDFVSGTPVYDTMPDGEVSFYPANGLNKVTVYKIILVIGIIVCLAGIVRVLNKSKKGTKRNTKK